MFFKKLIVLLLFTPYVHLPVYAQENATIDSLRKVSDKLSQHERDSVLHVWLLQNNFNEEVVGWLHRMLYRTHLSNGQADSALMHALKAYEIDIKRNDKAAQAADISNILAYYLHTDQPQRAMKYAKTLEKLIPVVIDPMKKFVYLQNIGNIYQQTGEIETALLYYAQAETVAMANGISNYLGWMYQNMASLYMNDIKDTTYGRELYKKALEIADTNNDKELQAYGYIGLAMCNNQPQDSLPSAIAWLLKAEAIATQLEMPRLKAEIEEILANNYYKIENYTKAYDHLRKFVDLKTDIQRNEKAETLAEIENNFENKLKDAELALSRNEAKQAHMWKNVYRISSFVAVFFAIGLIMFFRQRNRLAQQNQTLAAQRINSLMQDQQLNIYNAQLAAQEKERQRVAHELHDRVGGILSSMKMHFEGVKSNLTAENLENVERLFTTSHLLDDAYQEIRRISHNLEAGFIVQMGLFGSIKKLVQTVEKNSGIATEVNFFESEVPIKTEVQTAVYRIVQELVTNTIKHAKAKNISLHITQHHHELNLIYEDNGVGMKSEKYAQGIGYRSIDNRVKKMNGQWEVSSTKKKGTTFVMTIPLA